MQTMWLTMIREYPVRHRSTLPALFGFGIRTAVLDGGSECPSVRFYVKLCDLGAR